MKKIKININKISKAEIGLIADFLQCGQVIAYPTDTIYGLGCLATDQKAIKKVYEIKKRDPKKPFIILVDSLLMVKKYGVINNQQEKILKSIWPGPVTVLLKNRGVLPTNLSAGLSNLAVRLPNNKFLRSIIKRVGSPIVSTSLNLSGQPNLYSPQVIEKYFKKKKPDLVVNAGILPKVKPSTIIDLTKKDKIIIVRK